jgi:WD40 repeat protein
MAVARNGQTATLLQDGDVLIAGGSGDNTAELYDPKTGTFGETGPMNVVRTLGATATLLPDGRVLIAGGSDNSIDLKPLASAELYDPATGKFSPTGSMARARYDHTATLLQDGRILVAGGFGSSGEFLASAELYDPATGKFSPTGSMTRPRSDHTATLLADGRVLIVGGSENLGVQKAKAALASAELYDPKTGKFVTTGSMLTGRSAGQAATLLADGLVLVAGGNASYVQEEPLASAELYDPKTGSFHKTGSMAEARDSHTATLLPDGRVLVAGGDDSTAELYDPEVGVFGSTGSMIVERASHSATLLADGRVLMAGGANNPADGATAEVYQP